MEEINQPQENASGNGATGSSNLISRAMNVMFKPQEEWKLIGQETPSANKIFWGYVFPLALIPFIATIVGYGAVGVKMGSLFGQSITFKSWPYAISNALTSLGTNLVGVFVLATIVNALANSFNSKPDMGRAMQLVAYSLTPMWVAGIFIMYPPISFIAFLAGIYGIYLMYLGFSHTMQTPKDKIAVYLIITIVIHIVLYIILGLLLAMVFMNVIPNANPVSNLFNF